MNATALHDLDWHSIRDEVLENIDGIRPATYEELMNAIETVHDPDDIPMGVLNKAVDEGLLQKKGDGLDDTYTFHISQDDPEEDEAAVDSHITDDGRQYAPEMVARDQWVLYEDGEKQVKAPWQTGTLYNASWGEQLDPADYPETDFDSAQRWSERALSAGLPGVKDCGEVYPGFLLQRKVKSPEQNITMLDLDDCRDPETGDILPEAQDIIDRAGSYTEVSMSGAGVHVFVFGHLPDWYPSSRLVEPFETDEQPAGEQPKVEIYHRKRIAITTGDHLDGTPMNVTDGHDLIEDLCETYYDDDRTAEDVMGDLSSTSDEEDFDGNSSSSDRSPYFDVDPASLLDNGSYRQVGSRVQGPHPAHGSTGGSSYQDGGRNFSVEDGVWTCYRHGTGGNALHLVAVMESYIDCDAAGSGCFEALSDVEYAQLCMDARDQYSAFSADWNPPYRALLGVAKSQGLASDSADEFDYGLKDLLTQMYDGGESSML